MEEKNEVKVVGSYQPREGLITLSFKQPLWSLKGTNRSQECIELTNKNPCYLLKAQCDTLKVIITGTVHCVESSLSVGQAVHVGEGQVLAAPSSHHPEVAEEKIKL